MAKVQVMYDLGAWPSRRFTRAITLMLNSVGTPVVQIAGDDHRYYHNLSHHACEEKLTQLK